MKPTPPHGTTKNTAISIEQCNEQRGLQSAQNLINLEDYYDDDDDLHVLNFLPNDTHFGKRKRPFSICMEPKSTNELFSIEFCSYSYCTDCIVKYVDSKLRESITSIRCPIVPKEVSDRWGNALCEGVINGAEKFYCPFKDCSALLINDGLKNMKESKRPYCKRMFCAQCKVPWHAGMRCEKFRKLNKNEKNSEDMELIKLAEEKKWKRCPHCNYSV
ncbi:hypothetical protein CISIN_1g041841mg [Citrus sinensis]|uniref:RBR-type E3 ubiquitin transferase n=1 Tax=Citrus sinensis TaxID=2711 RepID=A0A067GEA7_CITSI|nr:hypothetical protein CISIN_1g041841mg [Citrus sinensis]